MNDLNKLIEESQSLIRCQICGSYDMIHITTESFSDGRKIQASRCNKCGRNAWRPIATPGKNRGKSTIIRTKSVANLRGVSKTKFLT